MPRQARLILTNTAHHIVQRGHNRNAVFIVPSDFQYYLNTLREWKAELGVQVYGYCLIGKCQDIVYKFLCQDIVNSLSGLKLCCLLWAVVSTQLVFKFIHLTLLME